MDLNTFYKHALQWKHQQDEAECLVVQEQEGEIKRAWETIATLIRKELPIAGMTIHETEVNQFSHFPLQGRLIDVDCCLDPNLKEKIAIGLGELIYGVIRVRVFWDMEDHEPVWKILKYTVCVEDRQIDYMNPYAAFLAIYYGLSKSAEME
jgi:hypothetical protein